MKKLVILVAPTGNQRDLDSSHVPMQPSEIAEEALRCAKAGAAAFHIHARDKEGRPTGDPKVFGEIISRIREKCDLLIQTTTGIGLKFDSNGKPVFPTHEERLGLLTINPAQDLVSIAPGSWEVFHPAGNYNRPTSFMNSADFLEKNISAVVKRGIPWEFEIADVGFLHNAARFADQGLFDRNSSSFWLDYCLGFGGIPATANSLVYLVEEGRRVFPHAKWEILATGKEQFPMSTLAMALGCDIVRVGFEDNIYLPNGQPARNNYQLVDTIVRIAEGLGREIATVAEAKTIFGVTH